MEENKDKNFNDILADAQDYLDTRIELVKLSIVERGAKAISDFTTNITVVVCFLLAFLFASITLALYLSEVLNSYAAGFGCVAGIYLLIALIVFITKDRFIEKHLNNFFIRRYFNKLADEDEDDEKKL